MHICGKKQIERELKAKGRRSKRRSGEGPHPRNDLIFPPQSAFTAGARGTGFCSGSSYTPKSTIKGWGLCRSGAEGRLGPALQQRDGCR